MNKYTPLAKYLSKLDTNSVTLTPAEVERIIGDKLPESAFIYESAWWANDRTHKHAVDGWLDAGWETSDVAVRARTVQFTRVAR